MKMLEKCISWSRRKLLPPGTRRKYMKGAGEERTGQAKEGRGVEDFKGSESCI